jgi:hypothetical protein
MYKPKVPKYMCEPKVPNYMFELWMQLPMYILHFIWRDLILRNLRYVYL